MGKRPLSTSYLRIGPFTIALELPNNAWQQLIDRRYRPFLISRPSRKIYTRVLISASTPAGGSTTVRVSGDSSTIQLTRDDFSSRTSLPGLSTELACECNRYSFDSWLRVFISVLCSRTDALLVHGAGTFIDGKSHLFYGVSGAGKSTITRILGKDRALSDELVLAYCTKKTWRAASTPFWGELKKNNGEIYDAPLSGIHQLKKAPGADKRSVPAIAALPGLLACVMHFDRCPEAVAAVLANVEALTRAVPPDILSFAKTTRQDELHKLLILKRSRP